LNQQGDDKPEPRLERITTLWRMRGTSGLNIECAAFRTATGMELRTMYSPGEIIASQLLRGPGRGRQDCQGRGSMALEPARERIFRRGVIWGRRVGGDPFGMSYRRFEI